jgi:hypothetical protein
MIAARFHTSCPDCSEPIEPGEMIGQIGIYYVCSECYADFERENSAARPVVSSYPVSGMHEAE